MSTSKYCPCFAPTGDTNIHFNNCLKDISDPIFVISTILLSNGGNRYLAVASSCPRIIHNPVKIEPRPCNKQVSKEDTMNELEYQHWHLLSSRYMPIAVYDGLIYLQTTAGLIVDVSIKYKHTSTYMLYVVLHCTYCMVAIKLVEIYINKCCLSS